MAETLIGKKPEVKCIVPPFYRSKGLIDGFFKEYFGEFVEGRRTPLKGAGNLRHTSEKI